MLKLDGILWTDPPTLSATGTLGHVVPERAVILLILIVQRRGRTILHTGQTSITFIVYAKVRHNVSP